MRVTFSSQDFKMMESTLAKAKEKIMARKELEIDFVKHPEAADLPERIDELLAKIEQIKKDAINAKAKKLDNL